MGRSRTRVQGTLKGRSLTLPSQTQVALELADLLLHLEAGPMFLQRVAQQGTGILGGPGRGGERESGGL